MGVNVLILTLMATTATFLLPIVNAECKDKVKDCKSIKKYCYNPPLWADFMKRNCQKTCPKHCDDRGTGAEGNGKCGRSTVQQSRIVVGVNAKKDAWPWIASMNFRGRISHFCGASLITPKWVLTASHCVIRKYAGKLEVILGDHDRNRDEGTEQKIYVKRIIMHPRYNSTTLDHDIALLELEKPAQFTKHVQPVCLPKRGEKPAVATRCYLAGWGAIKHPGFPHYLLQQAVLPVVDHKRCGSWSGIVCAGYGHSSTTNACRGDSGGPFVCRNSDGSWVQHGVTSYVVEYCKHYTAFAMVSNYIDWIHKNTGM